MIDKPSSLQLYLKDASQMMRRDALLAAAKKVEGLKSLLQRQMARLKDRPDAFRELLRAFAALLEPVALEPFWVLFILLFTSTLEQIDFLPESAMRAYRAIRLNHGSGEFESRRFIFEMGLIQDRP